MNRLSLLFICFVCLIGEISVAETSHARQTVQFGFPLPIWLPQNVSMNLLVDTPFTSAFLKQLRRQAVALAAREELGAATRDDFLHENAPEGSLKIESIDRFIVDDVEQHAGLNIFAQNADYPQFLAELEKMSRSEFVKALQKNGLVKADNSVDAAASENTETIDKLLHEFTVISQFETLRKIHTAIRQHGETPERLTRLVRGYTQLQLLTNNLPRDSHRVFQSRAMLYAQRLVAKYGETPELLAVRAAAWSLNNFHRIAREEFAAVPADTEQPGWIQLARLYAEFDIRGITAFIEKEKDHSELPLAKLIKFFLLELSNKKLAETYGQSIFSDFPDSHRLFFGLLAVGSDIQPPDNARFDAYFARKIAPALRKMDSLPQPVSQACQELRQLISGKSGGNPGGLLGVLLGGGQGRGGQGQQDEDKFPAENFYKSLANLFDRMNEAAKTEDHCEPSLSMLATLIQDETLQTSLFLIYRINSENSAEINVSVKTAFASHPLVNHFALAGRDNTVQEEYKKKLSEMRVPYEMLSQVRAGLEDLPGKEFWQQGKFISPYYLACRFADKENVRDMTAVHREIREHHFSRSTSLYTVDTLTKLCPKNALAVAERLNRNWTYNEAEAETILKEFENDSSVFEAVVYQFRKNNRLDKACAVMRKELKTRPDADLARRIADLYLEQGDTANTVEVLKEFAGVPEAGIAWKASQMLGRIFFMEGKNKEAEPYLDHPAAKTNPYLFLPFVPRYLESVGKLDEAESFFRPFESLNGFGAFQPPVISWWATCYRTKHARLADITDKLFDAYQQNKKEEGGREDYGEYQLYYIGYCMGIPVQEEFGSDPPVRVFFKYNQPVAGFLAFLEALENKDEAKAAALLKLLQERGTLLSKSDYWHAVNRANLASGQKMPRIEKQAFRLLAALLALDRRSQNPGALNPDAVETLLRISYRNILENEDALYILYVLGRYYTICGKKEKGLECYRRILAAKNLTEIFPGCFVIKELRAAELTEKDYLSWYQTDAKLPRKPVSKIETDEFSMRLFEALNTAEATMLSSLEVAEDETIFEIRRCELPISGIFFENAVPWSIPDLDFVRKIKIRSYRAAWSPDGKQIALNGDDFMVTLRSAQTGEELAVLKAPSKARGNDVVFAPDGNSLYYGGTNGDFALWKPELSTPREQTPLWKKNEHGFASSVAYSPNGDLLCTTSEADEKNSVFLWDKDGKLLRSMNPHKAKVYKAAFFSNGNRLITVGRDNTAFIYNAKTGKPILQLQGHQDIVRAVAISPDDKLIATGSEDDTVILWDAQTGTPLRRLGMFDGDVISLAFSPDGSKLAVGKNWNGNNTYIFDTKTWKTIFYAPGHGMWNHQPAWSPDGRFLVTCGEDTRIWKLPGDDKPDSTDAFAGKNEVLLKDFGVTGMASGGQPPKFEPSRSSRKTFENSLPAHASSRFVVHLNGNWQTFKTSYGITLSANLAQASCFFIVMGDGKELFRSELIRDHLDRPLELDVRNVKRLDLIVDPNNNNFNDHGVWFSPEILR